MRTRRIWITMLSLSCVCFLSMQVLHAQESAGNLVIVGGGLEADNQRVYLKLIELAGGIEHARFAVIPSASGVAMQSFIWFRNTLVTYGVKPENILLVEVAEMDDDSTSQINESSWAMNGDDPVMAEKVRTSTAVWFTGGDQARTTRTLFRKDGNKTRVLEAVWEIYSKGGVIGGTSAGAAIMSDPMIGDGTSFDALLRGVTETPVGKDPEELKGVLITKGLGFFPGGLVDQHFEVRGRIGRLLVALHHLRYIFSRGFGIDENTALVYYGKTQTVEVAGASGVTMVDVSGAEFSMKSNPAMRNIRIDYLMDGDQFDLNNGTVIPAPGRVIMNEEDKQMVTIRATGGLFADSPGFRELLLECAGNNNTQSITFIDHETAFRVNLRMIAGSRYYFEKYPKKGKQLTLANIRMDIETVKVSFTPIE